MRVRLTHHGRVSSEVDSFGIPVDFLKEKKCIIVKKMFPGLFISITVVEMNYFTNFVSSLHYYS